MRQESRIKIFFEIVIFCLIGLIPRLILLNHNHSGIESDEAIVGLMAKHILQGSGIPTFYYGQAYMGSLEAILVSFSFKLFGLSNFTLKLVPLTFSIVLIGLNYYFGFLIRGLMCARISGLITALAPSPLIVWSLKARGGFIETVVIGSICLLYLTKFIKPKLKDKMRFTYIVVIGLFAGLGWWTNNQIIFYYPCLAYGVLVVMGYLNLRQNLKIVGLGLLSFFIGSLPFWYYNLTSKPKWATFEVLFGKTAGSNKWDYFKNYWEMALPIILGARKFWSSADVFNGATLVVYSIYICIILFYFAKKEPRVNGFQQSYEEKKHLSRVSVVFLIFLITVPTIFSLSSFGWLSQAPRYLLPVYSVLPVALGLALSGASRYSLKQKLFATFLLCAVVGVNLNSNYYGGIADEGQPMLYKGQRVSDDQIPLYDWLKERNYHHVYTNYWIGYRMAFETNESITFTVFGAPKTVRIKSYETKDSNERYEDLSGKVLVLSPEEAVDISSWLRATGHCSKSHAVAGYTVIDSIMKKYPDGGKILLSKDQFRSFIPPDNSSKSASASAYENMVDDDLKTRWGSGEHQTLGMAIEIDLPEATPIHRIVIRYGEYVHDAPKFFNISGLGPNKKRFEIFSNSLPRSSTISEDYEISADWDIRFEPTSTTMIRLELIEGAPIFDWSIAEIELFTLKSQANNKAANIRLCD